MTTYLAGTDVLACPACGEAADPNHLSCEACGTDLHATATVAGHWLSSAAPNPRCGECGETAPNDETGYCPQCGNAIPKTSDRTELDLSRVAAATDFGRRHHYNQDAVAIGRIGDASVSVVCDGVSSSTTGELAALAATETAVAEILAALETGRDALESSHRAVRAAAKSATESGQHHADNPPSCTYVSAIVTNTDIVIVWVGDSRAYWVTESGARCLTIDDSRVGHLEAHGVPLDDPRYRAPYSKALLAWLGADAPDLHPNTIGFSPTESGWLIVCSDGLSGYWHSPADVNVPTNATPLAIAGELTAWARDQGGRDNISVAVTRFEIDHPTIMENPRPEDTEQK